jgi:hypothetical protein
MVQLTEPEQTKIRREMTTEFMKFFLTSGDLLPDYLSASLAKELKLPVAGIVSPPERSGPEFDAFVASCKTFWAAHSDPSTFTQQDNLALSKVYAAELDRELKITHPNYKSLPAAEQTKLLDDTKFPLIMLLVANGGIPSNYEAYTKKFASSSPSPQQEDSPTDGVSAALYLTVDGVKEIVCTKDGHLTAKYKTKDGLALRSSIGEFRRSCPLSRSKSKA